MIQVRLDERDAVFAVLREAGLSACSHVIGKPNTMDQPEVYRDAKKVFGAACAELQRNWSEVSWRIARLRDNPDCADSEYQLLQDATDPGISPVLTFDPGRTSPRRSSRTGSAARVDILREQGVNWAPGDGAQHAIAPVSTAHDVHMSDLIAGRVSLADFKGFVACGGFSYGDVLGAGEGWAQARILFNRADGRAVRGLLQPPGHLRASASATAARC